VIETLKAAFVQGRLGRDEFGLRVGQAFESRTYAELAALTADIPAGLVTVMPPAPASAQGEQPVLRPGPVLTAATAVYAGVWAYALLLSPHGDGDVKSHDSLAGLRRLLGLLDQPPSSAEVARSCLLRASSATLAASAPVMRR